MILKDQEITPGMVVRQDDGLLYRVDGVHQNTTGYERTHTLGGWIVDYTQLEQGGFPPGTEWRKPEDEFRQFFTPEIREENKNQVPRTLTVTELGLQPRVLRKLEECGISTVGQLCRFSRRSLPDFGITQLEIDLIEQALKASDLELNMANKGRR